MYVGITKQRVQDRWKKGSAYKGNPHFYNAICKYGWDGFDHEIFADNLTEDEAKNMEEILINYLDLQNIERGYNMTGGGNIPITYSDIVRKKISESVSGEKHPGYGKHLSEETRRRISESEKGVKKPAIAAMKSKPVVCVETNVSYPSAKEAARLTNIERTGITQVLTGKRKTAGGYHWVYKTNCLNF